MKKDDFAAFQSSYLSKKDLASPRVMTIEDVTEQELQGDGGKEMKPVVHFKNVDKGLVLNNVNWDTIQDAYGEDSDNWKGHPIELYFDPSIVFGAKKVGGIRVRLPRGERTNTHAPAPTNGDHWTFDKAVQEAIKVDITRPVLIERLKNAGITGWNAARDTPLVREMVEAAQAEAAFANMPSANQEEELT